MDEIIISLVIGRRSLEVRYDSFMLRELNFVLLSDLVSAFNLSSFVFIVASSSVFAVSILVLTLLLALILLRCSSYDVLKEDIFLS